MREPCVTVGILSGKEIEFSFLESEFTAYGSATPAAKERLCLVTGKQKAVWQAGKIHWQGRTYDELLFAPASASDAPFELSNVTIGIHFHWERKETQRFNGSLKLIIEEEQLTAINIIPVEAYLTSVISSEMSATAPPELLKAHAVISRSWLMNKLKSGTTDKETHTQASASQSPYIKWYDHEAHTHFDVCADDHCQRYQGITRASTRQVAEAIAATRGEVLMYNGRICDTRFSKCCGGVLEEFQNCWEDVRHPYLVGRRDSLSEPGLPDLTKEEEAEKWIRTTPQAFCNTQDRGILSRILNNYDRETADFYRWKVAYTRRELSELVHRRSGIDFGDITDLIPIERGTSGRIVRLKIVGTLRTLTIGKELEIRRTLSPSHLYSSAFVVDKEGKGAMPDRFVITGAGWGHGVGLCQIGAAVMGEQGYLYQEILSHYYPGSKPEKRYE